MKKLSVVMTIILSIVMMFSLTACNDENLSAELDVAYEKIDELNNMIDELNQSINDLSTSITEKGTEQELPKHKVRFITSGSEVSEMTVNSIMYSPTTIKNNHYFVGWYYDAETICPVTFPLSVNSEMTLYAKFKETRESLAHRFSSYIATNTDSEIEVEYPIVDSVIIKTIGELITVTATDENTTTSNGYTSTEKISINISFKYGCIDECSGTITYSKTFQGNGAYEYYNEMRSVVSVQKIGSFYQLYSRITSSFNDYEGIDTNAVGVKIESSVDYALSDIYYALFQTGFEDTILFYEN